MLFTGEKAILKTALLSLFSLKKQQSGDQSGEDEKRRLWGPNSNMHVPVERLVVLCQNMMACMI